MQVFDDWTSNIRGVWGVTSNKMQVSDVTTHTPLLFTTLIMTFKKLTFEVLWDETMETFPEALTSVTFLIEQFHK